MDPAQRSGQSPGPAVRPILLGMKPNLQKLWRSHLILDTTTSPVCLQEGGGWLVTDDAPPDLLHVAFKDFSPIIPMAACPFF